VGTNLPTAVRRRRTLETTVEAGVWQGLASVIIPGFTINRICVSSRFILKQVARSMPLHAQTWLTTFVGLAMIPVIIKPIDRYCCEINSIVLPPWFQSVADTLVPPTKEATLWQGIFCFYSKMVFITPHTN
jgi:hypothetical protein